MTFDKPALVDAKGVPLPDKEAEFDPQARGCSPAYGREVPETLPSTGSMGHGYQAPRRTNLPRYFSNQKVQYAKFVKEHIYGNGDLCFDWLILYCNDTIDARRLGPLQRPVGFFPRIDAWLGGDYLNWVPTEWDLATFKRDAREKRLCSPPVRKQEGD